MINPDDPIEVQVEKQAKIIAALIQRANRQRDLGPSAFQAFQSALELQEQVAAQTRDLERAANELESAKYERERTRRNLVAALSSMSDGIALFSNGVLEHCNDLFRDLLPDLSGTLRSGLKVSPFLQMFAKSAYFVSSDRDLEGLVDAAHSGAAVSAVVELTEDRWFKLSAQRTTGENLVLLITEITSLVRKNRDEKASLIDRQADYLQAVFQNVSSGLCTFSATGGIMMYNERFRLLLGLPEHVLQPGTSLRAVLGYMVDQDLIAPDQLHKAEDWRQDLRTHGNFRRRVRHGAGQVLDIYANSLPDGGFVVELKDTTLEARTQEELENRVMARTAELTRANEKLVREYDEKARVEEELRLAKERAEAAVSSKTRFLAAASHDLLQPINAAKLLISTLSQTTRHTRHAKIVDRIERAFGSAENLLHSLLDISRLESPEPDAVTPAEVSLAPIMESVFSDQVLVAEQKGVSLSMVPTQAVVISDPIYLLRSIQNLVVNAIQYTEPGGRVLFGCRHRGPNVVLQVCDTGIGVAEEEQEKIFEEFARAANVPANTGMGLGLSVVDRAARLLGHRLQVSSKPSVGSVFSIEMARADTPTVVSAPAETLLASDETRLEYIVLVLDNDPAVLEGMTLWLEEWGASALAARTIEEAVAHVDAMGMAPDIILADYQLDEAQTGVDGIARLRAMVGEQIPAILITANRSEKLWRIGIEQDFSVMAKPAKLNRLRSLIDWRVRRFRTNPDENVFAISTKVARDA